MSVVCLLDGSFLCDQMIFYFYHSSFDHSSLKANSLEDAISHSSPQDTLPPPIPAASIEEVAPAAQSFSATHEEIAALTAHAAAAGRDISMSGGVHGDE